MRDNTLIETLQLIYANFILISVVIRCDRSVSIVLSLWLIKWHKLLCEYDYKLSAMDVTLCMEL